MDVGEMPDDLVGAGVVTAGGEPVTDRHDQLDCVVGGLVGERCGRRERGSNAVSPSAR
jgi:hypothetical protein